LISDLKKRRVSELPDELDGLMILPIFKAVFLIKLCNNPAGKIIAAISTRLQFSFDAANLDFALRLHDIPFTGFIAGFAPFAGPLLPYTA
jgi:hypothetical protein